MSGVFLDTNVVLYLLSEDERKANIAEAILAQGGAISVQVLNEAASVCIRKLKMPWPEVHEFLDGVKACCEVLPLTLIFHEQALTLVERYSFPWYDSLIVAAALETGCETLYSEDMQNGQVIEERLHVVNPFV